MLFIDDPTVTWPYWAGPVAALIVLILALASYRKGANVTGTFLLLLAPVVLLFIYWILLYAVFAIFGGIILFLVVGAIWALFD